jgi:hypothetical protein
MLEAYDGPINNSIPTTIKEMHHARLFALDINRSQPERTVKGIFGFQDNMGERFIALLPSVESSVVESIADEAQIGYACPSEGNYSKTGIGG